MISRVVAAAVVVVVCCSSPFGENDGNFYGINGVRPTAAANHNNSERTDGLQGENAAGNNAGLNPHRSILFLYLPFG